MSFTARGAAPDADGGEFSLLADGDARISGTITLTPRGQSGGGGLLTVSTGKTLTSTSSAILDARGNRGGGGEVELSIGGDAQVAGSIRAGGSSGEPAGSILLNSGGNIELRGTMTNAGTLGNNAVSVDGCRVTMFSGATIGNNTTNGLTEFILRESGRVASGASMSATGSGSVNRIIYRDPAKLPVISGSATPTPQLLVDPRLKGCPVCGNSEIDQGESCDDGNTQNGDGCSADCVNEGCKAGTPAYPGVPLCSDENPCTRDTCNLNTSRCEHTPKCSDGIACTEDTCVEGQCTYIPNDASCSDGNVCTDDLCITATGCVNPSNTLACNDGLFCTENDRCDVGSCRGTAASCSDSINCTIDSCNEATDRCEHEPNHGVCGNGQFCDGAERCDLARGCSTGLAVDCSSEATQCQSGFCDETTDACAAKNIRESLPCDDADPCTVSDICRNGLRRGTAINNCGACGNGIVETSSNEDCDDGDTIYNQGEACSASCRFIGCGKPTNSGKVKPTSADALFALRAAVRLVSCALSVCDVDNSGTIFAADALVILKAAVGLPVPLKCPRGV